MGPRFIFATSNAGKFREASRGIRRHFPDAVVEQDATSYPELQEDDVELVARGTLELVKGNWSDDDIVFVDDSGLFVDALKGFPGVYSSYVFRTIGHPGIGQLLSEVNDIKSRSAHFKAVVAAHVPGHGVSLHTGICPGHITTSPAGDGGFGFDPIFVPDGFDRTFAELDIEEKNTVSHRGLAFDAFMVYLKETLNP